MSQSNPDNSQTFGRWTVVHRITSRKWLCRCECGREREVRSDVLKRGESRSCGCAVGSWRHAPDLSGTVFGRWTVLSRSRSQERVGHRYWLCRCECGIEREVREKSLYLGESLSCGCVSRWRADGRSRTRAYQAWQHMLRRCQNPQDHAYARYGGRGIRVCARWQELANFCADMGDPSDGLSLERVNNNGDYEPGNCVWATVKQQQRNTRANRYITVCGDQITIPEACERFGLSRHSIYNQISRRGDTRIEAFLAVLERRLGQEKFSR